MPDFGQMGRREAIKQLFEGTPFEPFQSPCLEAGGGSAVSESRLLLEGIDFDLVYFPLKHLGYKSVAAVTGALYSHLAGAGALNVVLGVSAKLNFDHIKEFWSGVVAAAVEFGYKTVGLDLQPSRNGLAVSVNALGIVPVSNAFAAPASKDLLCVSGALGAAYLGLQVLEKGRSKFEAGQDNREDLERYRMLVGAYLKPEIPAGLPGALAAAGVVPSAALLIDRGLADALQRLCASTGLGAKVYADRIPFEGGSFELGKSLNIDPVGAAMNGGEDFQLLLAVPLDKYETLRHDFQAFDIIGHLAQSDVGAVLVSPDGLEHPIDNL